MDTHCVISTAWGHSYMKKVLRRQIQLPGWYIHPQMLRGLVANSSPPHAFLKDCSVLMGAYWEQLPIPRQFLCNLLSRAASEVRLRLDCSWSHYLCLLSFLALSWFLHSMPVVSWETSLNGTLIGSVAMESYATQNIYICPCIILIKIWWHSIQVNFSND